MRVSKAFLIAAAAFLSAPLGAQEANNTAYAENAADPAASDLNAVDANAVDANLMAPPVVDPAATAEPVPMDTAAPADDEDGGFPWGVLGLLGLLGLIPRLRR